MRRRDAFNAYFRQACAEGCRPSALPRDVRDESARFWANTIPGLDGCILWDGGSDRFYRNGGNGIRPERWAWIDEHGPIDRYTPVGITCGTPGCVNPDHLALVPRAERRRAFSDEAALGALQVLALRLGRGPSRREWDEAKLPLKASAMQLRFGSWRAFLLKGGLAMPPPPHAASTADCILGIRALAEKLGHPPSGIEWDAHGDWLNEHGFPSSRKTIRNHLAPRLDDAIALALK